MPSGPTDQRPQPPVEEATAPPVPDRRSKQTFANMLRSLVPLVLIILGVVWWTTFRQSADVEPVKQIDPSTTVQLAANRADYPLLVPTDLPRGYRPTSARTDAGNAGEGDPVTLEIGYVTPSDEFAQYVVSDDPRDDAVTSLLGDATAAGSVQIAGDTWTRATRLHEQDEETVLSRTVDGVTVVVSGSASDEELETVAGSVQPYSG
jgi:cytoskeletal protein RodZ